MHHLVQASQRMTLMWQYDDLRSPRILRESQDNRISNPLFRTFFGLAIMFPTIRIFLSPTAATGKQNAHCGAMREPEAGTKQRPKGRAT